jgi:hypothetical protein
MMKLRDIQPLNIEYRPINEEAAKLLADYLDVLLRYEGWLRSHLDPGPRATVQQIAEAMHAYAEDRLRRHFIRQLAELQAACTTPVIIVKESDKVI